MTAILTHIHIYILSSTHIHAMDLMLHPMECQNSWSYSVRKSEKGSVTFGLSENRPSPKRRNTWITSAQLRPPTIAMKRKMLHTLLYTNHIMRILKIQCLACVASVPRCRRAESGQKGDACTGRWTPFHDLPLEVQFYCSSKSAHVCTRENIQCATSVCHMSMCNRSL